MKVEVLGTADRRLLAAGRRLARLVGRDFKRPRTLITVALVDDRCIRRLNRQFRNRNKATDVLAFKLDSSHPRTGIVHLGEVYVSRDRAREQARRFGLTCRAEICRLMLHGIFHLLGLSHKEMQTRYAKMLHALRRGCPGGPSSGFRTPEGIPGARSAGRRA